MSEWVISDDSIWGWDSRDDFIWFPDINHSGQGKYITRSDAFRFISNNEAWLFNAKKETFRYISKDGVWLFNTKEETFRYIATNDNFRFIAKKE